MPVDIARAWEDPEYRKSLTPEELASLPPNPVGNSKLTDNELDQVAGGVRMIGPESSIPNGGCPVDTYENCHRITYTCILEGCA